MGNINLSILDDIKYFKDKLYTALVIPDEYLTGLIHITLPLSVSSVTFTITIADTPENAYNRAMRIIDNGY